MGEENIAVVFPFLDCKQFDVDMAGAIGRFTGVDHVDGSSVIFEDSSRARRCIWIAKFGEDGADVFDGFGSGDGSDEFGLSRTGGYSWLDFGSVTNCGAADVDDEASGRTSGFEIGGKGGINICFEFEWVNGLRKRRKSGEIDIGRFLWKERRREVGKLCRTPICNAPVFGLAKV